MGSQPPRIDFQHQAVRDLAWVIGSAGLLRSGAADRVSDKWCRIALLDRLPWLRHLDNHPQALEQWLDEHQSHLLGHYFEALIAFWLRQWPRMELLASGLTVQSGKKVLGEFDFLFYDRFSAQTFHWECAVKYFLREAQGDGGYAWLGPNPRDTLANKYCKVFDKQLRLSSQAEASTLLAARGIETPIPQAFFKGYLFYPASGEWRRPQPIPSDSSPHHLRGWWCHADRLFQIPSSGDDSRWIVLERLHWLSPAVRPGPAPGWDRNGLEAWLAGHFSRAGTPQLLAELRPDNRGGWRECSRGFVVPAHWPQPATRE